MGTLTHRSNTVCTTPELLNEELEHLREALAKCKYPKWAINKKQNKYTNNNQKENGSNNNKQEDSTQGPDNSTCTEGRTNKDKTCTGHTVVPYVQGLGENLKMICSSYGVQTYFKGGATIKQLLVRPKDQVPKDCKSNVIYSYKCGEVDCDEEYIGETSRTLGERYKEHLNEQSPIYAYNLQTGYSTNPDKFNILGREDQGLTRLIKESIYIRINNPTLNGNIGKFNLSHIWDRVLLNTPILKLNNNKGQTQAQSNIPLQPITP